ncbi:MAG: hypothetical protein EBU46_11150 [Nitrosomonadaceae bacterium]|nr:hypothetical protein [Nitrosomonadaceae bacterium]
MKTCFTGAEKKVSRCEKSLWAGNESPPGWLDWMLPFTGSHLMKTKRENMNPMLFRSNPVNNFTEAQHNLLIRRSKV